MGNTTLALCCKILEILSNSTGVALSLPALGKEAIYHAVQGCNVESVFRVGRLTSVYFQKMQAPVRSQLVVYL